jgi:cell division protein FtsI (penicillin-binding protein 3)/stage V sporulation protein D (sporulation-specific penicillin-binding protein)
MAAQLIGFVGENDQGLDGIEMVLDKEIKGDVQKFHITTDRNNIPILESALEKILPDQERSVQLTIDSTIQYVVEKGLDGIMQRNHPSGAAIIVMNPKTGEILAMGSRPNFDPNEYGKGNAEAYKNRAVVNLYEPGSTFKPIMAASALDSGKWDINRVYHDVGYIDVDDRTIHNWDNAGMGNVTIKEILKFSINTGMAYIGMQMGGRIETEYARRFGFGQPTGIELPGEGAGILFDASSMSHIDEAIMGIGQGNAVTPLQMVQAFGAIANGGHMMKPYVIKEIDNPDGSIYKKAEPTEVGQPVSAEVSKTISKIMAEEISSGGGQNARVAGYDFCGKTGTAQRLNAEGTGYAEGQYIGSFVGFGPLEDPQFVVLIVVDNPSGVYYGAQVAAPVFKEIMEEIVRFKGIRPSHGQENLLPRRKQDIKGQHSIPDIHRSEDGILMPSFIGWDNREVNDWLDKAGLGFVPNGAGRAVYQSPKAGTYVRDGDDVHVTFLR